VKIGRAVLCNSPNKQTNANENITSLVEVKTMLSSAHSKNPTAL